MTILAVSIYKETKHVKDGIQLSYTPHSGATRIRNIAPGSLFAHSKDAHLLQPGMRIVSVNNIQCDGQSASQVAQFIRDSKGIVTVLVDDEITIYVEGSSSTTDISQDSIVHATIVSTASTVATSALTPTPSTTPAEPAMATPVDTTRTNPEVLDTVDTDDTYTTNPTGCINRVPPGLQGGRACWGTVKYFSDRYTAAILGHPLLCIVFSCPQDEKDAYQINGRVYGADEKYIGSPDSTRFVPSE